jgi:hypothetical protein
MRCSESHPAPAAAVWGQFRQTENLSGVLDIVAVIFQRSTVGNPMIQSKGYATIQHHELKLVFEFPADILFRGAKNMLVDTALECDLLAVLLPKLHDIHTGGRFTGVENIDTSLHKSLNVRSNIAVAVLREKLGSSGMDQIPDALIIGGNKLSD